IYPEPVDHSIRVTLKLEGSISSRLTAFVTDRETAFAMMEIILHDGENSFVYTMDKEALTWSEHTPHLYQLHLCLEQSEESVEESVFSFGLRKFAATDKYFTINGSRTFLRGKHEGMIFPMTGHAPTDVASWLKVLGTAKDYGINHYRFHTCCPPEAAFAAADLLGIYMEPELPFWGTITEEGEENHDEKAQQYLIEEGYHILDEFGNHPSFVMMSLGNELWGSKKRLNEILGRYKKYDNRHLYTQGSNNFQFVPCILDNEDFFCGVRFSADRSFRGSYAMCDAPQGHIQMAAPDMLYSYDQMIRPASVTDDLHNSGEVTIQYGTGTKTVKMDASSEIIPTVPVVSHEIGQYAMSPDFSEIKKYTGVLKARNFEIFQERIDKEGMQPMAEPFFKASGRLAVECYKAEIEAALKSSELAGFQLLDLQDFSGQGTALIGILNAFMENKGLVTPSEWQQFCSDTVLMAELPKLVFQAGESVTIGVKLAVFGLMGVVDPEIELTISDGEEAMIPNTISTQGEYQNGVYHLCDFTLQLPEALRPSKLTVMLRIIGTDICNNYDIWLYPEIRWANKLEDIIITGNIREACDNLKLGKKVLLYPENLKEANSIQGTYCTDFWCYPMFRSISESMGKPVPIGTLGLFIDHTHPAFEFFPTEYYTTASWYDIVSNSRAVILDGKEIKPLVWTIDNFERNHRLGNLFELKVGEGKLFVCSSDLRQLTESYPAKWLEYSILRYIGSKEFEPKAEIRIEEVEQIFR
ncbi:MAG: glycoside hydrolase family 2 TIM barrel-domain containing protein, partial [Mobilitalea sp.]